MFPIRTTNKNKRIFKSTQQGQPHEPYSYSMQTLYGWTRPFKYAIKKLLPDRHRPIHTKSLVNDLISWDSLWLICSQVLSLATVLRICHTRARSNEEAHAILQLRWIAAETSRVFGSRRLTSWSLEYTSERGKLHATRGWQTEPLACDPAGGSVAWCMQAGFCSTIALSVQERDLV